MKKRITAVLLVLCMAFTLLAACAAETVDTEKAKQIALADMGIEEGQASSVDVHLTTNDDGAACYSVYITYNGVQMEYVIHGKTGEILSSGESSHSHSH